MAKNRSKKKGQKSAKPQRPTQPDPKRDKSKIIKETTQYGGGHKEPVKDADSVKLVQPKVKNTGKKFAGNIDAIYNVAVQIAKNDLKVHAVSIIPDPQFENVLRLSFDENAKEDEIQAVRDQIMNSTNISANEIIVTKCKQLRQFAPYPVCIKHAKEHENVTGSSGLFFTSKGKVYACTCAHVLTGAEQVHVTDLFHMQSDKAIFDFKDPTFDFGFARLNPPSYPWNLHPTTIAGAVVNEPVSHFGCASVEESKGYVRSVRAYAKIADGSGAIVFESDQVVLLEIDSRHGDSGSPVVNDLNRVIGLIIGGDASSREIYCMDLEKLDKELPDKYSPRQYFLNTDGSLVRSKSVTRRDRRREIELQLHHGTIIREAQVGVFGEIISDEGVSVLTHVDHSFSDEVASLSEVWFFAVPLEYVVDPDEMAGVANASPLLAINVSQSRPHLEPLSGLHKRTPCGTGTTI